MSSSPPRDLRVTNLVVDDIAVIRRRLATPLVISNLVETGSLVVGGKLITDNTHLVNSDGVSTDKAVVRWDGVTGEIVQNSIITLSDTGLFNTVNSESTLQIDSQDVVRVDTAALSTYVGVNSGPPVIAPVQCVCVGHNAGTGFNNNGGNVAIGYNSLHAAINSGFNTAVGNRAMETATNSGNNTVVGRQALGSITNCQNNTVMGSLAGLALTSGNCNTLIGHSIGGASSGDNNTVVGCGADFQTGRTNCIVLGFNATSMAMDNQITIGDPTFHNNATITPTVVVNPATLANVGSGPLTAAQNKWFRIGIGTQIYYIPLWQ